MLLSYEFSWIKLIEFLHFIYFYLYYSNHDGIDAKDAVSKVNGIETVDARCPGVFKLSGCLIFIWDISYWGLIVKLS